MTTGAGTTGIILAAGDGGRLGSITSDTPKPLVPVGGRPLIAYTLDALAAAGVSDIVVVIGYRGPAIRAALGTRWGPGVSIEYVENHAFEGGNGYSLSCARQHLRRGAIVTMADHMVSPELIRRLAGGHADQARIAVDCGIEEPWVLDEATKVRFGLDGRISAIGKDLKDFAGVDAGAFYLAPDIASYLSQTAPSLELTDLVRRYLLRPGGMVASDITGSFWWDVDTLADLAAAEGFVAQRMASARPG